MQSDKKYELITKNIEEILLPEDLRGIIEKKIKLKHYIGFEISGYVHLGTGIMSMSKIKDFQEAGVDCSILLADWHTWINDKLDGRLETAREVAQDYFAEALKASLRCVGSEKKVKFVLGSRLYHNNDKYWETVVDIAKHTTLSRMLRSTTILGRELGESIDFAKLIYPAMQVADIFIQEVNITQAGIDQRKAHVIARDAALKLKRPLKFNNQPYKPVAVHHHLILGLQQPPVWPMQQEQLKNIMAKMKMSKSIPMSAVFIHDAPEIIGEKLNKAFCPVGNIEYNPVLDWVKHLIFNCAGTKKFTVERPIKFGGNTTFTNYQELEKAFAEQKLHPADLKKATAEALITLLAPARKHFKKPKPAEAKERLERLIKKSA